MRNPRQPEPDPYRKARFREAARAIVGKDRQDRKYGFAVDTAGAIARAMEQAYRQGFADAQAEPKPTTTLPDAAGAMEWALIPPRPRTAFWTICLFALGRDGGPEQAAYLVPATTERGTAGWQLILPDRLNHEKPIGEKTIIPLVRLALLETAADRLLLSARGKAPWQRFIACGGQYPEDLTAI